MAKTIKDIEFDLERHLSYMLHCASDDAHYAKADVRDLEVVLLRTLSSAVCTLAYVAGLDKESFLKAVADTWDNTKEAADEAAEKIEKYVETYKQALGVNEKKEEPIKN